MTTVDFIEKYKIICICRKIYGEELLALAHALRKGGIRMMEVTFDQADPECIKKTTEAIAMLHAEFGDELWAAKDVGKASAHQKSQGLFDAVVV